MLPFDDVVWSLKPVKTGKLTINRVHSPCVVLHYDKLHAWIITDESSDHLIRIIIHMYGREWIEAICNFAMKFSRP